jgi:hypothetical protein
MLGSPVVRSPAVSVARRRAGLGLVVVPAGAEDSPGAAGVSEKPSVLVVVSGPLV